LRNAVQITTWRGTRSVEAARAAAMLKTRRYELIGRLRLSLEMVEDPDRFEAETLSLSGDATVRSQARRGSLRRIRRSSLRNDDQPSFQGNPTAARDLSTVHWEHLSKGPPCGNECG
jgi:hypothetical protein